MSSNKRLERQLSATTSAGLGDLNKRNKQEWIESAVVLKRERFEVAGALFNCADDTLLSQQEVVQKVDVYLHPKSKEETVNVDTTE